MRGRAIAISPARRFVCDLLESAARVPSIPVQRRMDLREVVLAREDNLLRPSWPAIFIKAFARVCAATPELRRAYVQFPRPHLHEYAAVSANIAVEKDYLGDQEVFPGRIKDPAEMPLEEITRLIRRFKESPVEDIKQFRRALRLSQMPRPVRRLLWWVGLNVSRIRPRYFGTFALSTYSGLGAESLHPLSPLTTTLNYGIIGAGGSVDVRLIYDHRVLNGGTVARALANLEAELTGNILDELHSKVRSPSSYILPFRRAA